MCAAVVCARGMISDQYVRVACKMYEKVWEQQFANRSKRFMLKHSFAMRVLKCIGTDMLERAVTSYAKHMFDTPPNRVNVVFVPVLLNQHWWCVAFSMNREEILVIDSIATTEAAGQRRPCVKPWIWFSKEWTTIGVAEQLLSGLRPPFKSDVYVTELTTQLLLLMLLFVTITNYLCGIHMLLAIKRNAHKLVEELKLAEDLDKELEWLLCEDLLSPWNEEKEEVLELVKKHSMTNKKRKRKGEGTVGDDAMDSRTSIDAAVERPVLWSSDYSSGHDFLVDAKRWVFDEIYKAWCDSDKQLQDWVIETAAKNADQAQDVLKVPVTIDCRYVGSELQVPLERQAAVEKALDDAGNALKRS